MPYSYEELVRWGTEHEFAPMGDPSAGPVDYHRLQIERWLWDNRDRMVPQVIDIGAEFRREHLPHGSRSKIPPRDPNEARYATLNTQEYDVEYAAVRPDIKGSVTDLPFENESVSTIVCTEVLEHVPNLFKAMSELFRVLEPGGWAFIATPFLWPTHATVHYKDYWRITEDAYRFMMVDWDVVQINEIQMRPEARHNFGAVAAWEVMGNVLGQTAPTGYCVAGRKKEVGGWTRQLSTEEEKKPSTETGGMSRGFDPEKKEATS